MSVDPRTSSSHKTIIGAPPRKHHPRRSSSCSWRACRSLHLRLVSMHVLAVICQSAAVAKNILPVSDTSCLVTHGMMGSFVLLYMCNVSRRVGYITRWHQPNVFEKCRVHGLCRTSLCR
ncbi:unnamed protein product [Ectocarpus sp. 12 AP-2014]